MSQFEKFTERTTELFTKEPGWILVFGGLFCVVALAAVALLNYVQLN